MDETTNKILENKKDIHPIHLLLIIILLTVDYYSILRYGIELKLIKYLIDYKELLIINATLIGIFTLLSVLIKKVINQHNNSLAKSILILSVILAYSLNLTIDVFNSLLDDVILLLFLIVVILVNFPRITEHYFYIIPGYSHFIKNNTNILFILITLIFLYHNNINLNKYWDSVIIKNNEYSFLKYNLLETFFKQKVFSTNRLEILQTNVTFENSELYVNKLKEFRILENNLLKYDEQRLFISYIENENYKTFFIINKNECNLNETIKMFIVFSEKLKDMEKYKIIKIQEKDLWIEEK
ncbi:hypothetical protein PJV99_06485 [Aliarcobacter butzleri]|nr:hypothetical protein [Aliarcobacter butzleri]